MPNIRGPELLIIVLIIVMLFGAKRLPDMARSVGRSMRIFKAETKGLVDSEAPDGLPAEIPTAQDASPPEVEDAIRTAPTAPQPQPQQQAQPPRQG